MATFPTYAKIIWPDLAEAPESVVKRSEVERGIPKQRRDASDARVEVGIKIHFESGADVDAFDDWFYDEISAGQDWFDLPHPRTGRVLTTRIVGGELGELKYVDAALRIAERTLKVEYWRSAW